MVKFDDLINNELFICLLLIVIGYFIAKMFSNSCNCSNGVRNGFSVGAACPAGPNVCTGTDQADFCYNKQVIHGLNNDVSGCYQQYYNYSHNCGPSADRIIIPIDDVVQEGEQPGWSPRCFSWDKDDDPRPIYDCVPDNGIESCTEGGDELIQDCKEYCGVEKFACMKVADGMRSISPTVDGYQCRNLTLDERRNNHNGILPDDINPDNNGIYDTKDECNAANCGYNCIKLGNTTSCQLNKEDQIAYKDDLTCLGHCRYVFVCRKEPADDCYKTIRILVDDARVGETTYDEQSECERHCEDINHWCDDTGIVKECKCVGGDEPPEVFCNAINNVTCFSEDMCDLRCKPQNFVKYVCPTDPDYSTAGCVESTDPASAGDEFSWDASVDNATELMGIAKENCDAQGGENSGVCNRRCSTEDSHFDWNDCTKVGNQCVKQGTIQGNWAPTGIFSDDTCDIPNKTCTGQEAKAKNCILDCNIPEWDDKCTVDGNNCYRNLTFKDEYGRKCVNKPTQQLSCISLPVENYPNASAALMKKCNLNLQIQDVRHLISALTEVVHNNTELIAANLELIGTIQTRLQLLSEMVQQLKVDVAKDIKDLQDKINGLTGRLSDLTTQLTNLSGKVDTNTSSLTDLGNQVNDIDTRVTGIDTQVTGIDTRVTGLQTGVTDLQGQVGDVDVTALEDRVGVLEQAGLSDQLVQLQESVENNTNNLSVYNNDINNIIEGVNSAIDTANGYLNAGNKIQPITR